MLKVGISSCFFPPDNARPIFKGKTLLYLVQNLSDWILKEGAIAYVIPSLPPDSMIQMSDFVADLDALVLQGGSDVAPESYGEKPLNPEWKGDAPRDEYEIALFKAFRAQNKPILGVCRGLQLMNVALGGSLYQDINTQIPGSGPHRNWEIYDQNFHDVKIEKKSYLSSLYPQVDHARVRVNSIHHQAIKALAPNLRVEATSIPDNLIEAVRLVGDDSYVVGVQWHPEFQNDDDKALLSTEPLLLDFLRVAKERSQK